MSLCMVNSLPHASFVEPTEGVQIGSSLKQNAHIGMYEKTSMGVRENPVEDNIFPSEIPEALSLAEKDLSVASSFFCVTQSNHEEEWNVQVNLSAPRSIEGKNSSTQTEETSNLVATAEISGALSLANSVILVHSCECKVLGSGLTSGDALSAEFNVSGIDTSAPNVIVSMAESSWVGFQLCGEFTETKDSMSFADSDLETTQPYNKPNVDESCIVVDGNELSCISLAAAKHQSYKKKIREVFASKMKKAKSQECEHQAPGYEDSDAGSNQQEGDSLTPSVHARKYESANRDFCESEWEIV
ncbi:hypothetical protein F0562_013875 [Nyssa sinensis]|uniref:Uncharacterized protein n=1 Tax=Nyssa sinensis TaxID=561372 RepID=A0A5J4ZM05_9ASTE|nr:hypothetical protein F0562_013875 [Nyssa sinensis]